MRTAPVRGMRRGTRPSWASCTRRCGAWQCSMSSRAGSRRLLGAFGEHDDRLDVLTAALARHADHRRFPHRRMGCRQFSTSAGKIFSAPVLIIRVIVPRKVIGAVGFPASQVGGVPPATSEAVLVDLRAVPVPQVHQVAPDADLSGLADSALTVTVGVEDPHGGDRPGAAGVAEPVRAVLPAHAAFRSPRSARSRTRSGRQAPDRLVSSRHQALPRPAGRRWPSGAAVPVPCVLVQFDHLVIVSGIK